MSSASHLSHPLVDRLRDEMESRHLTQVQVAEQLGVSTRAVSYWMTSDVVPQKRYRQAIVSWLDGLERAA